MNLPQDETRRTHMEQEEQTEEDQSEATSLDETRGTEEERTSQAETKKVDPISAVGTRSRAVLEEFMASAEDLRELSSKLIARTDAVVALATALDDIDAIVTKT